MANTMQVVQDLRSQGASQRKILAVKKAGGIRTGDTVSDDSDSDDEADSSADEEYEVDAEDADVFDLSGSISVCQAGHSSKASGIIDSHAQASEGAELEDSNESDEEDYRAIDAISDSEVSCQRTGQRNCCL